jgi:cellulose synthase/poly-beta-1,6-N-acetylglucosamine synthase-like glycosyltransferase
LAQRLNRLFLIWSLSMLDIATIVLCGISLSLAILVLILAVEVSAGLFYRPATLTTESSRCAAAIIIPAHNEATTLDRTLAALLSQTQPEDTVWVIADNCTDDTAAVAQNWAAKTEARLGTFNVIERQNLDFRGKGHALAQGLQELASLAPPVIVFLDADCCLAAGSLDRLVTQADQQQRPVQARNQMEFYPPKSLGNRITEFAWTLKTYARPLGLLQLGLPCQLMGTGMAVPFAALAAVNLATDHLAEDVQLGLDLALVGRAPRFCPEAAVHSYFPRMDNAATEQRQRWVHGQLSLILQRFPELLRSLAQLLNWAFLTGDQSAKPATGYPHPNPLALIVLLLDLMVLPLSLLVSGLLAMTGGSLVFALLGGSWLPLGVSGLTLIGFIGVAIAALWRYDRSLLSLSALGSFLRYWLDKLPLYSRFIFRRQREWNRTQRDPAPSGPRPLPHPGETSTPTSIATPELVPEDEETVPCLSSGVPPVAADNATE